MTTKNSTTIQIALHDNTSFTVELENYNDVLLTEMLNNNQLTVVNIGGAIVSRGIVKTILPMPTQPVTP